MSVVVLATAGPALELEGTGVIGKAVVVAVLVAVDDVLSSIEVDVASLELATASLDVGASPICQTNVMPTLVICPEVAKEGGTNPPQ
jgi:hypothetical protein